MRQDLYKILLIIAITGIYTVFRYHIFGPVLWQDLPVFTFNKILIFSAIVIWFFLKTKTFNKHNRLLIVNILKSFIALHVLLSLSILKPYYLKEFFTTNGSFSLTGNLTLWAGILAAVIFFSGKTLQMSPQTKSSLFLIFVALHLIFMGGFTWLHPVKWYGGMPPVTLICFIIIVTTIFIPKTDS